MTPCFVGYVYILLINIDFMLSERCIDCLVLLGPTMLAHSLVIRLLCDARIIHAFMDGSMLQRVLWELLHGHTLISLSSASSNALIDDDATVDMEDLSTDITRVCAGEENKRSSNFDWLAGATHGYRLAERLF